MNKIYIPKQSNIGNKSFDEKYSSLGWGLVGMLTGGSVLAFLVVGMFGHKIL